MNNIKRTRKEQGLTQTEPAKKLGVTQGDLSAWKTDRWKPNMASLKNCAKR